MVVIVLLPVALHAASRAAPAQRQEARPQTATPANQPKPPATRRPVSLTPQTPLGEALDLLRHSTTPPLKIIVLWKPLGEAGIYRDTPIGIDGISGLRVKQYLELLVLSLSAGASTRVGYTVDKGVITISTTDALPVPKQIARVYDISDLVAPPARYSLSSVGLPLGYGNPVVPPGGFGGSPSYGVSGVSPGTNLSRPAGSTAPGTGPSPRPYRSR